MTFSKILVAFMKEDYLHLLLNLSIADHICKNKQCFSGGIAMYKVIDLDEKLFLQGKEGKEDRGVQGKRRCRGHQQQCNRGCQDLAG